MPIVAEDIVVLLFTEEDEQVEVFLPGEESPILGNMTDILLEDKQIKLLSQMLSACREAEDETLEVFRGIISHIALSAYQIGTGNFESL